MDMDAVTGPVQIIDPEIAEPEPAKSRWTSRPTMMVASAGVGAALATIVVLVWAFAAGPQSVKQEPKSDSVAAAPTAQPAGDALPPPAAPDAAGLPAGLPGLPAGLAPPGGAAGGAGTANPLAAFTPRPSVLSGGGGGASAPALPAFQPPPDLQTILDTVAPYVMPGLASQVVSGDAIVSLVSNVGGWATAAAVATASNGTSILNNIVLASSIAGNNPLAIFAGGVNAVASLANIPAALMNMPANLMASIANPVGALAGVASTLAVSMPALDALSKLPALPPIGLPILPPPPPFGLPPLPPPPPIGLPQPPPPPPIGLPPPPPPLMLAALGL